MSKWSSDQQSGWLHIPDQSVKKFKHEDAPPLNIGNLIAVADGLGSDSVLKIPFPDHIKKYMVNQDEFNRLLFQYIPENHSLISHPIMKSYFFDEFNDWLKQRQPVSSAYLGSRFALGSLLCYYILNEKTFQDIQQDGFQSDTIDTLKKGILVAIESFTTHWLKALRIFELDNYEQSLRILRSTLTVQIFSSPKSEVSILTLWAGDSRAYVIDHDCVYALTQDHQVSKDNESMTRLVQFQRRGQNWHFIDPFLDHTLITVKKPCLSLVFSDGIYSPFDNIHPDLTAIQIPLLLLDYTKQSQSMEILTSHLYKEFSQRDGRYIGDDCTLSMQFFTKDDKALDEIWPAKNALSQWIHKHYPALVKYIQEDKQNDELDSFIRRTARKYQVAMKNHLMALPLQKNNFIDRYPFFQAILEVVNEEKNRFEIYVKNVRNIVEKNIDQLLDYLVKNNLIEVFMKGLVSKIPYYKKEYWSEQTKLNQLMDNHESLVRKIDSFMSQFEEKLIKKIENLPSIKIEKNHGLYKDIYDKRDKINIEINLHVEYFYMMNKILFELIQYVPKTDILDLEKDKNRNYYFKEYKVLTVKKAYEDVKSIENKYFSTNNLVSHIIDYLDTRKLLTEKRITVDDLIGKITQNLTKEKPKLIQHFTNILIEKNNHPNVLWKDPFEALNFPKINKPDLEGLISTILNNHFKTLIFDSFLGENNLIDAIPDTERTQLHEEFKNLLSLQNGKNDLAKSYLKTVYQYIEVQNKKETI